MICTLSLTRVCIRLVCLQGSYRYLANWHQATKLHYSSNLLRTLDPVTFFHLQLLTFYHNTIDFLHLMTHSNFTCCVPSFTNDKRHWISKVPNLWLQFDFHNLTLSACSGSEKKIIVFLYFSDETVKKVDWERSGNLDILVCIERFIQNGNRK